MKITESKLREMIREVIVELTGTSSSRGAKKTGHKTAEKDVSAEPKVTSGNSSQYPGKSIDVGKSAKYKGTHSGKGVTYYSDSADAFQGHWFPGGTTANDDYKAWEKEKRDAQKKDTKATREKPKGQKDPAASARRPSGKKGSKKKGKNKDDE